MKFLRNVEKKKKRLIMLLIIIIGVSSILLIRYQTEIELLQKLDKPLPENYDVEYETYSGKYGWMGVQVNYSVRDSHMVFLKSYFRASSPMTCNQTSDSEGIQSCVCKEGNNIVNCTGNAITPDQTNKLSELIQRIKKSVLNWTVINKFNDCYENLLGKYEEKICFSGDKIVYYHYYFTRMGSETIQDYNIYY